MQTTMKWDMADDIKTPEDVRDYLNAALEENDMDLTLAVIGDLARSEGMAKIAKNTGMGRESLYKSLSVGGNPSFATILKVLSAMGYKLQVA